jgi:serpin B
MTRLVIVNAVYFNAKWLQPFNTEDTNVGKFHISSHKQVDVPMMHLKTYLGYKHVASLKVRILELPYEVRSPH